jgi:hypothetical protein
MCLERCTESEWRVAARKFRRKAGCHAAAENRSLYLGRPFRTLITVSPTLTQSSKTRTSLKLHIIDFIVDGLMDIFRRENFKVPLVNTLVDRSQ